MSRVLSRQEVIVALLESLSSVRESLGVNEGGRGEGERSRLLLMPADYHQGSYKQLELCLIIMRKVERQLWWHVSHRYVRSVERTTWICPRAAGGCGRSLQSQKKRDWHVHGQKVPALWGVAREWPSSVDEGLVEKGVEWLSVRLPERLWLPKELFGVLAA